MKLFKTQLSIFNEIFNGNDVPHCLFEGQMVGEIFTAVTNILKSKIGHEEWKSYCMCINAKLEHGIKSLRKRIHLFSKVIPQCREKKKFIIIYFADDLTEDAQSAIRYNIELFAESTRFIFICENIHKIMDPIQSRCFHIPFPLPNTTELESYFCQRYKNVPQNIIQASIRKYPHVVQVENHIKLFDESSMTQTMMEYMLRQSDQTITDMNHINEAICDQLLFTDVIEHTNLENSEKQLLRQYCIQGGQVKEQIRPFMC